MFSSLMGTRKFPTAQHQFHKLMTVCTSAQRRATDGDVTCLRVYRVWRRWCHSTQRLSSRRWTRMHVIQNAGFQGCCFFAYGYFNFTRQAFLEHAKNFKESDVLADMTGKNCVITGANSGLGMETAKALAARGATVCLVCRNKERGEKALEDLKASTGTTSAYLEICDLSLVEDVKAFASRYSSSGQPLHVLVNNAGTGGNTARTVTDEGLEVNFAVNVAAVYVLTESLIPALEKAAPEARVITVSSGGMYSQPLYQDMQFEEGKFDGLVAYARNKRVQVALAEKWSEVYGSKGIGFYSAHPGWADTNLVQQHMPDFRRRLADRIRTPEQGADTLVWLALQPNSKLQPGGFYFDRSQAPKHLPGCRTSYTAEQLALVYSALAAYKQQGGLK